MRCCTLLPYQFGWGHGCGPRPSKNHQPNMPAAVIILVKKEFNKALRMDFEDKERVIRKT